MNYIKQIIRLIRVKQWVKNAFVFLPVFFGGHLFDPEFLTPSLWAFFAFCFASSAVYCLNDILDADADRNHPVKCRRPIASGALSKRTGCVVALGMVLLAAYAVILSDSVSNLGILTAVYLLLNVAYCLWLKRIPLVDVIAIAAGFVLRVCAGGVTSGVWLSQWIVLMTFLISLFLAFAKRRDDVEIHERTGVQMRVSVKSYNLQFLNSVITMLAAVTMVCYLMYTLSDDVIARVGTSDLYLTSVWVLAGLLRYLQQTIVASDSGSPTKVLLRDRFTQVCVVGWLLSFMLILYLL